MESQREPSHCWSPCFCVDGLFHCFFQVGVTVRLSLVHPLYAALVLEVNQTKSWPTTSRGMHIPPVFYFESSGILYCGRQLQLLILSILSNCFDNTAMRSTS